MTQALLHRIRGSGKTHLISAEDLRTLCAELRDMGDYQILARHRDGEKMDRIELTVSVPKERAST
jgi:hypothetical protein